MSSETNEFLDAFNVAFTIVADLAVILGRDLNITTLTDLLQLIYALVKRKRITDRRLMVEISSA